MIESSILKELIESHAKFADKAGFSKIEINKKESERLNTEMLERKRESAASKKQAKLYTENATVKYWLEGLGDSSKKQYLRYFPRIMDYVHAVEGLEDVTPDELIEMRKADLNARARKI